MTGTKKYNFCWRTSSQIVVFLVAAVSISGCQTAAEHARSVDEANTTGSTLTVGTVQREIKVGMSGADVAGVLGSPNIVSTDGQRREVWIYDKISTNVAYSQSSGGVSTLILGGGLIGSALVGGAVAPSYSSSAGASSRTQKTLTVIIKFDEKKIVRDFAYHTSRF